MLSEFVFIEARVFFIGSSFRPSLIVSSLLIIGGTFLENFSRISISSFDFLSSSSSLFSAFIFKAVLSKFSITSF